LDEEMIREINKELAERAQDPLPDDDEDL